MKKIIAIFSIAILIFTNIAVFADEPEFSIADKIRSFMLPADPAALEKVGDMQNTYLELAFETSAKGKGYTPEQRKEKRDEYFDLFNLIPENSFCFYPITTTRYAKQYADTYNFDNLISDEKIWAVVNKIASSTYGIFEKDLDVGSATGFIKSYSISVDEETINFLKDPDKIEQMIKDEIDEKIIDCKLIKSYVLTLYLKGQHNDYGITLFGGSQIKNDPVYLEKFKVHKMSDLWDSYTKFANSFHFQEALDQKPLYETEAQSLQAAGLLQGNEKGLDLLKPLNRIEATTILVRALGLENTPTDTASKFTDIPDDNWGVKYANIAYDAGITRGIGDNKFAPDDLITGDQFATLLLRNSESEEFDWQTAINILIEKNIITPENAETMDLFTRGDMAKIIYEAREKGLIQ